MQTTARLAAAALDLSFDDLLMFQGTPASILAAAAAGQLDLLQLAREELACRGLDTAGKWVGFDRAAEIARRA